MKDRLGKILWQSRDWLGLLESLPNHKEEKVRHFTEVQSSQSSQRLWLHNGRFVFHAEVSWGTSVNKGICIFSWWLHYHLRWDSKSPGAWRKKVGYIFSPIKLEMISEIRGHLPFAMRSALKLLKVLKDMLKWTISSSLFNIADEGGEVLWQLLRYYEGSQYSLGLLSARVTCLLRRVSTSSLLCQTSWSLVLVIGN